MRESIRPNAQHPVPPVSHRHGAIARLLSQGRLVVALAAAQCVAVHLLLLADRVGAEAGVLLVCRILPLRDSGAGVACAEAAHAGQLALPTLAVEVLECPVGVLLLSIVGVLRHGALVERLVVLSAHCLTNLVESVAGSDQGAHGGHTRRSSGCVALPTLHILQVSRPVVESLTICQLSAATCQEVGVGGICARSSLNEGVLINLLVSCLRRALVVVLVGWPANTGHADATHARYRDAAVRARLDDPRLANLKL